MNANFRGKGASPTNDFWHQRSSVPGLSYGEKIAEKFNRLSRVHQRHRRQTDGIAMASNDRERGFTSAKNDTVNKQRRRNLTKLNDNVLRVLQILSNRFTFGRVITERVNTAKKCRKVNPIFG